MWQKYEKQDRINGKLKVNEYTRKGVTESRDSFGSFQ